ncbi:TPA: hypothetical protein N0F65_009500, partial [Lagenidium giganteum]
GSVYFVRPAVYLNLSRVNEKRTPAPSIDANLGASKAVPFVMVHYQWLLAMVTAPGTLVGTVVVHGVIRAGRANAWLLRPPARRSTTARPSMVSMLWMPMAAATVGMSSVATCMTMLNLRIRWDVHVSSVRWLFFLFFVYLFIWCVTRFALYVWLLGMTRDDFEDIDGRLSASQLDRLGVIGVPHLEASRHLGVIVLMIVGDTALFGYALSMFPLTYELWKIATKSMDRGVKKEREHIKLYTWMLHTVMAVFLGVEVVLAIVYEGYTKKSSICIMFIYCVQFMSLVFMLSLLWMLRVRGRKYESVQGVFVASPVYQRLKRIMVVYSFFSFQFQVASLILQLTSETREAVLEYVGFSLFIYHASGLALAITTGCSQECVLSLFACCIPDEIEAHFLHRPGVPAQDLSDVEQHEPPHGAPIFVFTDIESSSALWSIADGRFMQAATDLHDDILRSTLAKYRGYEITTAGDAFQLAFRTIKEAAEYCMDVQMQLLCAPWPKQLEGMVPATRKVRAGHRVVFNGLRVRMGIHDTHPSDGVLVEQTHAVTGKATYTGASQVIANEVGDLGDGGQILITRRVADWLMANESNMRMEYRVERVDTYSIPQVNAHLEIYQLLPLLLCARRRLFSTSLRRRMANISFAGPSSVYGLTIHDHRSSFDNGHTVRTHMWTEVGAVVMGVSMLATMITAAHLLVHSRDQRVSCVRWLFGLFFVDLTVWCIARFIKTIWLYAALRDETHEEGEADNLYNQFDQFGPHSVTLLRQGDNTATMTGVVITGDVALFGVVLVSFALTRELTLLVTTSMDGGAKKERAKVALYSRIIYGMMGVLLVVEVVMALWEQGYSEHTHACKLFVYATQTTSMLFIGYSLHQLKRSGRKFEPVHGVFVQSPLYTRLKRIMIVYALFTCQFQLSSLVNQFTTYNDHVVIAFSGISSILYCATGLALSITTGCSQTCVINMCRCCMPDDVEAHDYSDTQRYVAEEPMIAPPSCSPVFVFTDIESSSDLWGMDGGRVMQQATEIHDNILRGALTKYGGYEIATAGDAFQLAFHSIRHAVEYCIYVQAALLSATWPKALHGLVPATKRQRSGRRWIFSGIRVRMGIHDTHESEGALVCSQHAVTGKMTYTGASEVVANEVGDLGNGGQILVTQRVANWITANENKLSRKVEVDFVSKYTMPQLHTAFDIYQVNSATLAARKQHWSKTLRRHLGSLAVTRQSMDSIAMLASRPSDPDVPGVHTTTFWRKCLLYGHPRLKQAGSRHRSRPNQHTRFGPDTLSEHNWSSHMRLIWTPVAAVMMGLSAVATTAAFLYLRRFMRMATTRISTVQWLFGKFFAYLALWSLARFVYMVWLWYVLCEQVDAGVLQESDYNQFDRLGSQAVDLIHEYRSAFMSSMMVIGDAALMGVALSTFPLARELWRLASQSMDGGVVKEQAKMRRYGCIVHALLLTFVCVELGLAVRDGGYSTACYTCKLVVYGVQMFSLAVVAAALLNLKCSGRKFESVQGVFVQSPLYERLKRIMIVYAFFTCQFQMSSVILQFVNDPYCLFTRFYGSLSLILYCSTGLALSITTACSQLCFLKLCSCWIPDDLEAQLIESSRSNGTCPANPAAEAPTTNVVFVFTDIEASSALWGIGEGKIMQEATEIHDRILRGTLTKHHGYEITTCGDSFQIAFHTVHDAVEYCLDVQQALLVAKWPKELHGLVDATKKQRSGVRQIFRGLRVRMGIHATDHFDGTLICRAHDVTGKMTYTGAAEVLASEVGDLGSGGQILITQAVADWVRENADFLNTSCEVESVGLYVSPQLRTKHELYQLNAKKLAGRKATFKPLKNIQVDAIWKLQPHRRNGSPFIFDERKRSRPHTVAIHPRVPATSASPYVERKTSVRCGLTSPLDHELCTQTYAVMIWVMLATLTMGASSFATIATSIYLKWHGMALRVSSIRWLFGIFFMCLVGWSTPRFIYFSWFWSVAESYSSIDPQDDEQSNQFGPFGLRTTATTRKNDPTILAILQMVGDIALIGIAVCSFPVARELWLLAQKSMDGGAEKEKRKIRRYRWVIFGSMSAFAALKIPLRIIYGKNSKYVNMCKLLSYGIQLVSLLFIAGTLIQLKCSGRKFEPVQGVIIQSPLYARLKNLLVIYSLFTCQFQLSSFILSYVTYNGRVYVVYSGVSLILYSATGLVLSIATACSQRCILRLCEHWLPPPDLEAQLIPCPVNSPEEPQTNIRPPLKNPVFVYTDVEASSTLWNLGNGTIMHQATEVHDSLLRAALIRFHGYEVATAGDSFQLAFHSIRQAVNYCMYVQTALLDAPWPKGLHGFIPSTAKVRCGHRVVFRGLRVRMGIHDAHESEGSMVCHPHAVTGRMTYTGTSQVIASEVSDLGDGGQVLVTRRVAEWIREHTNDLASKCDVDFVAKYPIVQLGTTLDIFQINPQSLVTRKQYFPQGLRRSCAIPSGTTYATPSVLEDPSTSPVTTDSDSSCEQGKIAAFGAL